MQPTPNIVVCALYKFVALDGLPSLRRRLLAVLLRHRVCGTLLLAPEGINGTIAGGRDAVDAALAWIARQPGLGGIEPKVSFADAPPFKRARVKLKREIVTIGVRDLARGDAPAGTMVAPQDWNALTDADDVTVIDARNQYEVAIGTFDRAVDPALSNFREFPAFADRLDRAAHKKIAMFCTGGIRCEKATAYLLQQGFEAVYQLRGGILKYLECVPESESKWRGECFVFDDRVAVDHRLRPGAYEQCHACRAPLSAADKRSAHYVAGASCPRCYAHKSDADRARFAEREKQVALATERGGAHLGPQAMTKP
ncbi:MAG: rhodanese-related sulfurtransferase [bacterium]